MKSILRAALAATMLVACSSAAHADVSPTQPIDRLVKSQTDYESGPMDQQKACLAEAVYNESGSEPMEGRLAVAHVIINRTHAPGFAKSLCGVVNQRGQFTYPRGRGVRKGEMRQWLEAKAVATLAMRGVLSEVVNKALFFHSGRYPGWSNVRLVGRIGGHVFYARR